MNCHCIIQQFPEKEILLNKCWEISPGDFGTKRKQEDKMASPGHNSIANELLKTISNAKFTQALCLLNPEFALTINYFKRIKDIAHNSYWIDTQKCITKSGKPIASGIFDIFGHFES